MKADKDRIYDVLKRNEGTWVCSGIFFRELFIKDYAQRISDLRSKGHDIEGIKCDQHDHRLFMYKLKKKDYTREDQLNLLTI